MLNVCTLMGRFTHSPEVRTTKNGLKFMKFSLAVPRSKASAEGKRETDFIDFVAWGNTAEFICKYFKKGDPVAITGSLATRNYEDKQVNKRKACEVIVKEVNFCAAKKSDSQNEDEGFTDISDEDLPF